MHRLVLVFTTSKKVRLCEVSNKSSLEQEYCLGNVSSVSWEQQSGKLFVEYHSGNHIVYATSTSTSVRRFACAVVSSDD